MNENMDKTLAPAGRAKWGSRGRVARQQSRTAHVAFGSLANDFACSPHVRCAPNSDKTAAMR